MVIKCTIWTTYSQLLIDHKNYSTEKSHTSITLRSAVTLRWLKDTIIVEKRALLFATPNLINVP